MSKAPEMYMARGFPFERALERAPNSLIRSIVGEPLIALLRLLETNLASDAKLRELAREMADPALILSTAAQREALLEGLSINKAVELAGQFGLTAEPMLSLYRRLNRTLAEADDLSPLFDFFGITADERAITVRRPTSLALDVAYGLFPHQRTAARRVIHALEEMPRRALLHMPTGAGKTRTAMHILCEHLRIHGPTVVCWLANSPELLEQAADEFERAWASLGDRPLSLTRFWGTRDVDLGALRDGVLVGGFQKLHALSSRNANDLLALADRTSLTIVDEAHQAIAPSYCAVIESLATKQPQGRLLGLSATPGRTWNDVDADAALSTFFGRRKVMLEVEGYPDPVEYLMSAGYLARPRFRTLNYQSGSALREADVEALARALDVPEALLQELAEDEQRNLRIVTAIEDLMTRHRRIMVFAATVKHAHLIRAVLRARGHEAHVVTGDMDQGSRERAIRRYKSNAPESLVMCNFGVLTTGFDAPKTSAAVIARPTRSLVLYSQMVGRATRGPQAGGNATAEILTVVDPDLPGFGDVAAAFKNWEDVWNG